MTILFVGFSGWVYYHIMYVTRPRFKWADSKDRESDLMRFGDYDPETGEKKTGKNTAEIRESEKEAVVQGIKRIEWLEEQGLVSPKEAKKQREDRGRQSIDSRSHRGKLAWRKVISDVDDTLTCSGGTWPAGIDSSYPRKTVYPGVLAFYRELDLGFHSNSDAWDRRKHVGNLVFLSARPHVYKDVSEVQSYKKFRDLQEKRDLYTSPTLLAGSLIIALAFFFAAL